MSFNPCSFVVPLTLVCYQYKHTSFVTYIYYHFVHVYGFTNNISTPPVIWTLARHARLKHVGQSWEFTVGQMTAECRGSCTRKSFTLSLKQCYDLRWIMTTDSCTNWALAGRCQYRFQLWKDAVSNKIIHQTLQDSPWDPGQDQYQTKTRSFKTLTHTDTRPRTRARFSSKVFTLFSIYFKWCIYLKHYITPPPPPPQKKKISAIYLHMRKPAFWSIHH